MRTLQKGVLAGAVLAAGSAVHAGTITNGSFEAGFTGYSVTGQTSIQNSTYGANPTNGFNQALATSGSGSVSDSLLESFLGLTSGSIDTLSGGNATEGSGFKQTITANVGDTLSFNYNFLTNEGTPTSPVVNDTAFFSIVSASGAQELADTNGAFVLSPTPFSEETGYLTRTYTFSSSGSFTLGFGVVDLGDTIVDSGLLIDNIQINGGALPVAAVPLPAAVWGGIALMGGLGLKRFRRGNPTL